MSRRQPHYPTTSNKPPSNKSPVLVSEPRSPRPCPDLDPRRNLPTVHAARPAAQCPRNPARLPALDNLKKVVGYASRLPPRASRPPLVVPCTKTPLYLPECPLLTSAATEFGHFQN